MTDSSSSKNYNRVVRTVCSPNCMGTCGVNAFVKDERIIKLEPATFPDARYERICSRGIAMATERVHHPDRLTHPLIRTGNRGEGKWRKASWDEAFDYILTRLKRIADTDGWRSNAWIKMTGNYGFRAATAADRASNCLGGTTFTSLDLSSDGATSMGYRPVTGAHNASNELADAKHARFFLSAGRNMADTGHSDMHFLFDAMEQGLKYVVIDPRFSRTSAKADIWLAPRPGTDAALALGMINVVVSEGLFDQDYVVRHTNAPVLVDVNTQSCLREKDLVAGGGDGLMVWDAARARPARLGEIPTPALQGRWDINTAANTRIVCATAFDLSWDEWKKYSPEHASSICDVPASEIRRVAIEYATTNPAWIQIGWGLQRYSNGHLVVRAWTTLAALCGNIGKPFAGVHTADGAFPAFMKGLPASWWRPGGKAGHSLPGVRMVETIADGAPYPIRSLWMVAYNFGAQSPLMRRFIEEALPKLDLFVVNEQVMTRTAEYADVVLPCVSYYEDDWDLVGNVESWFMQLRRRAIQPIGDSKSDYDIFAELCGRLGHGNDWPTDHETICRDVLAEHMDPRMRAIDWGTLCRDGVARVPIERPHVPFQDMKFETPSGRLEIFLEQFADIGEAILKHDEPFEAGRYHDGRRFPLNLLTYKHVHSTHSQHTILPSIREMLPEPRLEISPQDALPRGIRERDIVEVFNDRGAFQVRARIMDGARPGLVCIPQGFWEKHFIVGHPSDLGHIPESAAQTRIRETNYPTWDIACDVRRIDH